MVNLVTKANGSEPTCGQCCVAMLCGLTEDEACERMGHRRSTCLGDLHDALTDDVYIIEPAQRIVGPLPKGEICLVTAHITTPGPKRHKHWFVWDGEFILCPDNGVFIVEDMNDPHCRLTSYYEVLYG